VGTLSALVMTVFVAILMLVDRPIADSFDELASHPSIRCAWAPTCSAAHGITVSTAADPASRTASSLAAEVREQERSLVTRHPQAQVIDRHPVPGPLRGSNARSLSIGFYVDWDDNSYPDLKRTLPHLDWVIPSWLSLVGPTMDLKTDLDGRVLKYIQATKPDIPILPMIQNAVDGKWDGAGLAKLLANPPARGPGSKSSLRFSRRTSFRD